MTSLLRLIGLALTALILAACSSSSTDGDAADTPEGPAIIIEEFSFGDPLTVPPGTTITVVNRDNEMHDLTSDEDLFEAATNPGDSTTFTAPQTPGEYPFTCHAHPYMHGTLIVSGEAVPTSAPS